MAGEGRRTLRAAVQSLVDSRQERIDLVPAFLGAYLNGQKTIRVADSPDYVWCRIRGSTSQRTMAFNAHSGGVSHHFDLPILIYKDPAYPDIWKVYGRDLVRYDNWSGDPYIVPHGQSHSFVGKPHYGDDPVWVSKTQILPLMPYPVASGTMGINIMQDYYFYLGHYHWFGGTGTTSLEPYKPTGSYTVRYVTIYIEGETGALNYIRGDEWNPLNPPADRGEKIAVPTPAQGVPVAAVFLQTGTERIGWGEIYDLRFIQVPPPGTGSTTVVFDESNFLGGVTGFNFVGPDLTVVISGSYAHVVHTEAGGGLQQLGHMAWDDGVPLCTGVIVDYGDNLDASCSGSVLRVDVDTFTGIMVEDEGTPQGLADNLNFVGAGVTASHAGMKGTVYIPGGGGGGEAVISQTGSYYTRYDPLAPPEGACVGVNDIYSYEFGGEGTVGTVLPLGSEGNDNNEWAELDPYNQVSVTNYAFGATIQNVGNTTGSMGGVYKRLSNYDGGPQEFMITTKVHVRGLSDHAGLFVANTDFTGTTSFGVFSVGLRRYATGTMIQTYLWNTVDVKDRTLLRQHTLPDWCESAYLKIKARRSGGGSPQVSIDFSYSLEGIREIDMVGYTMPVNSGTTDCPAYGGIFAERPTTFTPAFSFFRAFDVVGLSSCGAFPGRRVLSGADRYLVGIISGSIMAMDEDSPLGLTDAINFKGAGVSSTLVGSQFDVTIPAVGGAPQLGHMAWDDGVPIGTGTIVDYGDGLDVSLSGTVIRADIPNWDSIVTGTVVVYDESTFRGLHKEIRFFGDSVDVQNSGSYAAVTIQTDFNVWDAMAPPATGTSYDDDFSDGGLGAQWTIFDPTGSLALGGALIEAEYGLQIQPSYTNQYTHQWVGVFEDAPTGTFSAWTYVSVSSRQVGGFNAALALFEDADGDPANTNIVIHSLYCGSAGMGLQGQIWYDYNSWSGTYINEVTGLWTAGGVFLRVRKLADGTMEFDYSHDGIGWFRKVTTTLPFHPEQIGLLVYTDHDAWASRAIFQFMRVLENESGLVTVMPGNRVGHFLTD